MKTMIDTNKSGDQLKSIIARIEKLECDKADIAGDIRDIYAESKAHGFDTTAIRQIIKLRKLDENERTEQEEVVATYMRVLEMLPELEDNEAA